MPILTPRFFIFYFTQNRTHPASLFSLFPVFFPTFSRFSIKLIRHFPKKQKQISKPMYWRFYPPLPLGNSCVVTWHGWKATMSYHSRRILTPGASRKRKEREALYSLKPSASTASALALAPAPAPAPAQASKPSELKSSNRLLAGYMAYEFLTRGTLLGQKFDPARAEAVPVGSLSSSAESKREAEPSVKKKEHQSYGEVANILKTEGTHIPDIVNPTQLARWIQMWNSLTWHSLIRYKPRQIRKTKKKFFLKSPEIYRMFEVVMNEWWRWWWWVSYENINTISNFEFWHLFFFLLWLSLSF